MELRQAVDGDIEEVGSRVLEAVPARVVGGVAEPEVGAQVDDSGAGRGQLQGDLDPCAVGEGHEDRVERRIGSVGSAALTVSPVVARCGWMPSIGSWSRSRPTRPDDLDVRVPRQQPDQLATDIARRPDDPDPQPARAALGVDPALGARQEALVWLVGIGWTSCHRRMTIHCNCIVMQPASNPDRKPGHLPQSMPIESINPSADVSTGALSTPSSHTVMLSSDISRGESSAAPAAQPDGASRRGPLAPLSIWRLGAHTRSVPGLCA